MNVTRNPNSGRTLCRPRTIFHLFIGAMLIAGIGVRPAEAQTFIYRGNTSGGIDQVGPWIAVGTQSYVPLQPVIGVMNGSVSAAQMTTTTTSIGQGLTLGGIKIGDGTAAGNLTGNTVTFIGAGLPLYLGFNTTIVAKAIDMSQAAGANVTFGPLINETLVVSQVWDTGNTTLSIGGAVLGIGMNITKVGNGTLVLGGATASTFSGGLFWNDGSLVLNKSTALGTGTLTINATSIAILDSTQVGGTTLTTNNAQNWLVNFTFQGTRDLNMGTGSVLMGGSRNITVTAGNFTVGGAISGNASGVGLTKSGLGTLILTGTNTYDGGTTLNAGTLRISSDGALGATGNVVNFNGTSTLALAGNFGLGASRTFGVATGAAATFDTLGNSVTVNGAIGGLGGIVKAGNGTLTLNGNNIGLLGGVTLSAGTLNLGTANALGAGTFTIAGGTFDNTFGSALALVSNNLQTWSGNFTFAGTNNLDLGTGAVTMSGSRTVTITANTLTVGGIIGGGAVGLTKTGAGILVFTNANSYTGATTVNQGTLKLDFSAASAPASDILNAGSSLVMAGGTLNLVGKSATTNSQTVNGATFNSGASTVTVTDNGATALTLNLGAITRNSGSTVNFVISTNGVVATTTGTANSILTNSNGVPYATYGGDDWAAKNAGNTNIASLTSVSGYSLTTGTTLGAGPNADVDSGVDTVLATGASKTSLRFNQAQSRTIDLNGNNLSIGGILDTSAANTFTSLITGGTLQAAAAGENIVVIVSGATGNLSIASVITNNTTASGLTKSGNGVLSLNGVNSFTGPTTINAGSIRLLNGSSLQSSVVTAQGSGSLLFGSGLVSATIGGLGGSNNLSLLNFDSNPVALTLNTSLGVSASYSGILNGGGSVTKAGLGSQTLGGANTFSGTTVISGGTLVLANSQALQNSTLNYNNQGGSISFGTLTSASLAGLTGAQNLSLTNGSGVGVALTLTTLSDNVFSGIISGSGSIVKSGSAAITLSGANSYGGGTTLNSGKINIASRTAIGTGTFTVAGGTFDNTSGNNSLTMPNNAEVWNANLNFLGTNSLNMGTGAVTMTLSPTITVVANTLTIGGTISGPGFSLTKAGSGGLTLSGINIFNGGVFLNAGTLNLNNSNALGLGAFTINGGALDNTTGASLTMANNQQKWGGDFAFTGTNNLNMGTGLVAMLGSRTITVNAGTLTIGGSISGTGFSLTKAGVGTLNLSATAGFYTGGVNVAGGTLIFAADGSLGSTAGNLTFTGSSTFRPSAAATISGARNVVINPGVTVSVNTTQASLTITGNISGAGGLTKDSNTGTLILAGTNNTFAGGVTLNAGTLGVSSTVALGTGTLTINGGTFNNTSGASFTLTTNNPIVLGGNFTFTASNSLNIGTGAVTLTGTRAINVVGNNLTFGGVISDGGNGYGIIKNGAGALNFTNTNTYTGDTNLREGNITLRFSLLSPTNIVNSGSSLSMGGGSTGGTALTLVGVNGAANSQTFDGSTFSAGPNTVALRSNLGSLTLDFGALTRNANGVLFLNTVGNSTFTTLASSGTASSILKSAAGTPYVVINNVDWGAKNAANTAIVGLSTLPGGYVNSTVSSLGSTGDNVDAVVTNTYTSSSTTITSLRFNTNQAGPTVIDLGSNVLTVGGILQTANLVTVGAGTTIYNGTIRGASGADLVVVQNSGQTLTLAGVVTDNGGATNLNKFGTGTLVLGAANTHTGSTVLYAGTLQLSNALALQSSTLDVEGGAISFGTTLGALSGNQNINMATTTLIVNATRGTNTTYSGVLSGAGGVLIINGNSMLTLTGANTFTGGTIFNGGTLNINNGAAVGATASRFTISEGVTLDNTSGGAVTMGNNNPMSWNGNFTFLGTNSLNMGTGAVTMDESRNITVNANSLTINGAIGGAGFGIVKLGAGNLDLSGTNTFDGGVVLAQGRLSINDNGALPSGTSLTIYDGTSINSGGGITLGNVSMTWLGNFTFAGGGTLNLGTGNVTSSGDRVLTISGSTLTIGGNISGGSLTKLGAGTLTLTGNASSYTGGTTIDQGTLNINGDAALGVIAPVTFTGNATFGATGNDVTTAFGRTFVIGSGLVATFNAGGSDLTISSLISGDGSIIKTGAGTLQLIGAPGGNTYTGSTTISNGTLSLDFAAGGAPTNNIINAVSNLIIVAGADLLVNGSASDNSQTFNSTTFIGGTIGEADVDVQGNGGNVTVNLGNLIRSGGAIVDFSTTGSNPILVVTGATPSSIILSGGTPYATVNDQAEWAALDASGNIVALSAINGYTNTTATTMAGNAFATVTATTLATSSAISSLTFGFDQTTNIDLFSGAPNTLVVGGILQTAGVSGVSSTSNIYNGTITGATPGGDLVIIQNSVQALNITSTIADNTTATGLSLYGNNNGTLVLGGANTFTGPTNVYAGTVTINNAQALQYSAISVFSGNLNFGSLAAAATMPSFSLPTGQTLGLINASAAPVALTLNQTGTATISNGMTGTGSVTKTGAGTITLAGGSSYSGGTNLNAGQLNINNNTAVGAAGGRFTIASGTAIDNTSGGTITLNNNNTLTFGNFTFQGSNNLNLGTGATAMGGGIVTNAGDALGNSTTITVNGSTLTLNGVITGNMMGIIKAGSGTLTLGGSNVFAGNFTLNGGTVNINNAGSATNSFTVSTVTAGSNVLPVAATANAFVGAKITGTGIAFNTTVTAITTNVNVTMSRVATGPGTAVTVTEAGRSPIGSGTFVINADGVGINNTSGGALTLAAVIPEIWNGNFTFGGTNSLGLGTGAITLTGNRVVTVNGSSLTVGGIISGTNFSLTKAGAGTLVLSGANLFGNGLILNGGTVSIATDAGVGAANGNIGVIGNSVLTNTATIALSGHKIAVSPGATLTFDTGTNTLTVSSNISGGGNIAKLGTGTLELVGTSTTGNAYTGTTTVSIGTLTGNFAATGAPNNNIINPTNTLAMGSPTGATFNVRGLAGSSNIQSLAGITFNTGLSQVVLTGAASPVTSLTLNLGTLTRNNAAIANFTTTLSATAFHFGVTGGTSSTIITSNGTPYALFGGNDWAAYSIAGTEVTSFSSSVGYGNTTSSTLGATANPSFLSATTTLNPGTTANITSLTAFRNQTSTLDLGGLTSLLSVGGILQTSALTGVNTTTITNGNLTGANSGQDLVVINNSALALTLATSIIDYGAGSTGLTKSGTGPLILDAVNTFSGNTTILGGQIQIYNALALQNSIVNLISSSGSLTFLGSASVLGGLSGIQNLAIAGVTLTLNATHNTAMDYSGDLSGAAGGLILNGNSMLTLSGANSYTGSTVINGGTLNINSNTATGTGTLTLNSGVFVDNTSGGDIVLTNNNAKVFNGTFTYLGSTGNLNLGNGSLSSTGNLSRTLFVTSNTVLIGSNGTAMTGNESTRYTKDGDGTLALYSANYTGNVTFSGNNSYFGGWTIERGTLAIYGNIDNLLGNISIPTTAGYLVINGTLAVLGNTTTLSAAANNTLTILPTRGISLGNPAGSNGTISVTDNTTLIYGGIIANQSSNNGLIKTGNGTLSLTGNASTYSGTTQIFAGTVSLSGNNGSQFGLGTGNLLIAGNSSLVFTNGNSSTFANTRDVAIGAGVVLALDTGANGTIFNGNISGTTGGIVKSGAGFLTLAGNNSTFGTAGGGLTLTSGTLNLNNDYALGSGGATLNIAGSTVLDNTNPGNVTLRNVAQNWNGDFFFTGTGNLSLGGGAVTMVGGSRTITVANRILRVDGGIGDGSNGYGLTKAGFGTLILSGSNGYSGATTLIGGGTLQLDFSQPTSPPTNILNPLTQLVLTGGTFILTGNSGTGVNSQTVGGTTLNGGAIVSLLPGSVTNNVTLNLGAITRGTGGAVNFLSSEPVNSNITTSSGTNGLILTSGGIPYATFNSNDWAAKNNGVIVGLSSVAGYTNIGTPGSTLPTGNANFDVAGTIGLLADASANSIRFNVDGVETISGAFALSVGGMLVNSAVNTNPVISTSFLQSTQVGGDIVVFQNSGSLTGMLISAVLRDNGTASGFTKAGTGNLTLAPAGGGGNLFTGLTNIDGGTLYLGDANALQYSALNYNNQGGSISFANLTTASFGGLSGTQNLALTNNTPSVNSVGLTLNVSTGSTYASSGNISGNTTGAGSLTKIGGGIQSLSGFSTFTGNMNLNGGTLNINGSNALGLGIFNIAVDGVSIDNTSGAAVTVATNNPIAFSSNFTYAGAAGGSLSLGTGTVTFASNHTLTVSSGVLTIGGTISGAGRLTKDGSGTLVLAGNSSNYSGGTVIAGGTLSILADLNLGAAPGSVAAGLNNIVINGGTLDIGAGAAITLNANRGLTIGPSSGAGNATINVGAGAAVTYAGVIADNGAGSGTLIKNGAGTLFIGNSNNSFTGSIIINSGTLAMTTSNSLSGGPIFMNGATLSWNAGSGNLALANPLTISGFNTLTNVGNLNSQISFTLFGDANAVFNIVLSGTGQPLMSGDWTNYQGTIFFTSAGGNIRVTNPLFGSAQATYDFGAPTTALNLTYGQNGTPTGIWNINFGAIVNGNTNVVIGAGSGGTNTRITTYVIGAKNLDTAFGGTFVNGVTAASQTALRKVGNGTLTFTNINNNLYTGMLTIADGTVQIGDGGTAGTLSKPASGTPGAVANNSYLVFKHADDITVANQIGGGGNVTQAGSGRLTLTGSNSYNGITTVTSGILSVNVLSDGALAVSGTTEGDAPRSVITNGGTAAGPAYGTTDFGFGPIGNGNIATLVNGSTTAGLHVGQTLIANPLVAANTTIAAIIDDYTIVLSQSALTQPGTTSFMADDMTFAGNSTVTVGDTTGLTPGMFVGGAGMSPGTTILSVLDGTHLLLSQAPTVTGTSTFTFGISSGIGTATSAASNLVLNGGSIGYSGNGAASTNRQFTLGLLGGGIDASGTGSNGTLTFTSTATVALGGGNGARTFTLGGSNTGNNSFNGVLVDSGAGVTSLAKTGNGKWNINSAQGYTGTTAINSGTLVLNADLNITATTVGDGATLTAVGNRLIGGVLTVSSNGTVNPGPSTVSTLTVGGLTLQSGSIFNYDFTNSPSAANDLITTSGTVTVNGGGFNLYAVGTSNPWGLPGNYSLIHYGSLTGSVASLQVLNPAEGFGYGFSNNITLHDIVVTFTQTPLPFTWVGLSGNASSGGNWGTGSNWSEGTSPNSAGTTANFLNYLVQDTQITVNGGFTVGGLHMNSGFAYTLSPLSGAVGNLTLDNNGSAAEVSGWLGTHTIAVPLALTAGGMTGNIVTGARINISGNISGATGIVKTGGGILGLTGNNSYLGGTSINGGTVAITNTFGLGASSNDVTFANGTLRYEGVTDVSNHNLIFAAGGATFDTNGFNEVLASGNVGHGGAGNFTKTGEGILTLGGNNSTNFWRTFVNQGELEFGNLTNFGSGIITINGGALRWSNTTIPSGADISSRTLVFGANGATFDTNGINATLNGVIGGGGSGSLTKSGNGRLTLGSANTFTGSTIITGGTLRITNDNQLGVAPIVGTTDAIVINGATLESNAGNIAINSNRRISLGPDSGSGSGTISVTGGTGNNNILYYNGTLNNYGSGTGQFIKTGNGTLYLGGSGSSFNGGSIVNGGTLVVASTSVLPGNITLTNNATIRFNATTSNVLTVVGSGVLGGGSGPGFVQGNGTLYVVSTRGQAETFYSGFTGTVFFGPVNYENNATLGNGFTAANVTLLDGSNFHSWNGGIINFGNLNGTSGSILAGQRINPIGGFTQYLIGFRNEDGVFSGQIQDGPQGTLPSQSQTSITKVGTGRLTLNGSGNFTGQVTINAGTLQLGSGGISGGLGAFNGTVANSGTLAFGRSDTFNLANIIDGTGGIEQFGPGTLTLGTYYDEEGNVTANVTANFTASANTYTGSTALSGGTLQLQGITNGQVISQIGNSTNVASNLILNGGTLQFAGNSSANGSTDRLLTVTNNGGTLDGSGNGTAFNFTNPGSIATTGSATHTLTLTGNYAGVNTFAPSIVDGAAGVTGVNKLGATTWKLTANSTYTGTTGVSAGTLDIEATFGNTSIILSGGTLTGNATFGSTSNMTVNSGATVAPGTPTSGNVGSMSVGSLTMNNGSIFNFELSGSGNLTTSDRLNVTSSGGLVINAGSTFGFYDLVGGQFSTTGNYALLTYLGSISGNMGNLTGNIDFTVANAHAGFDYYFKALGGSLFVNIALHPAPYSWNVDASGNWSLNTNWVDNVIPNAAGITANFPALLTTTANVTVDGAFTVGGLNFTSGVGYTIANGGGNLTLDNSGLAAQITVSSGSHRINAPLVLTTFGVTANVSSGSTITIGGNISGPGAITKVNNGELDLAGGNNSYSGGVNLNQGTLGINSPTALGTGTLTITGGTFLDNTTGANVTVSTGNTQLWNGNFTFIGTSNLGLGTGSVTMSDNRTVTVNANVLTVSGSIGGVGLTLTKNGSGTLALGGTSTYDGGTVINAGTVRFDANNALADSGNVTLSGGTLDVSNFNDTVALVTLTNGTIKGGSGLLLGTFEALNGNISANVGGSLTKNSITGTVLLSGTNQFTGNVILNAGTLALNSAGALGNNRLTVNGGFLTNTSGATVTLVNGNTFRLNSLLNFTGNHDLNLGVGAVDLLTSSVLTITHLPGETLTMTIGGVITTGTNLLTVAGNGTLVLTGANNFDSDQGTLLVLTGNGSTLTLAGTGSISGNSSSAGTGIFKIGTTGNDSVTLNLQGNSSINTNNGIYTSITTGNRSVSSTVNLTQNATLTANNLWIANGSAAAFLSGNSATSVFNQNDNTTVNLTGFSGNATIAYALVLGGDPTSFGTNRNTATYNLNGGILTTGNIGAGVLGSTGQAIFNFNGGTLRTNGDYTDFMGGLTAANVMDGGAKIDTDAYNITISQALLKGSVTDGGLTKLGTGILTLLGTSNYTGTTAINAGTVVLTGNLGGTTVNVNNGALLTGAGGIGGPVNVNNGGMLTSSGTFGGLLTVNSGGTVSPGGPAISTLTTGSLVAGSGSIFNFDFIAGLNDLIKVTATDGLTINGGNVFLYNAGTTDPWLQTGSFSLFQFVGNVSGNIHLLHVGNPDTVFFNYDFATTTNLSGSFLQVLISTSFVPYSWNTSSGGSWGLNTNWTFNTTPDAANITVRFPNNVIFQARTVTLDGNRTAGALDFSSNIPFTIEGNATTHLTLTSNVTPSISVSAGNHVVSADLVLSSALAVNVTNGARVNLNGNISSGSLGLTLDGNGTLALGGSNNTFTGGIILNNGTLALNSNKALGAAVGNLTINGGNLSNTSNTSVTITNNNLQFWTGNFGASLSGDGDLNMGTGAVTMTNNVNLRVAGGNLIEGGAIEGSGFSLAKRGTGNLWLGGANTFDGGLTVMNGIVTLFGGDDRLLATSNVTLGNITTNGTLVLGSASGVSNQTLTGLFANTTGSSVRGGNASANSILTLNLTEDNVFNAVIGDGSANITAGNRISLVKDGFAALTLSGANTYTGGTHVKDGTLIVDTESSLGTNLSNAATGLILDDNTILNVVGTYASNRWITVSGLNSSIQVDTGVTLTLGGNSSISGTGDLNKTGGGDLTLAGRTGNYTYTGNTSITGGSLTVNAAEMIPNGSAVIISSSTLNINANETVGSVSGDGLINIESNTTTFTVGADGTDTTYSGTINGNGSLAKAGAGILSLSGINGYTGTTSILAGNLSVDSGAALQGSTVNYVTSGGSLVFGSGISSATFGALAGNKSLALTNLSSGAVDLTVGGNDQNSLYTGILSGAGSLSKVGSGTMTITGNQTYTGGTSISSGTLQLGNGVTNGVVVGTINLSGSGTLETNETVDTTLAASITGTTTGGLKKSGPVVLTVSGTVNFNGPIIVNAGKLKVTGSTGASNPITVNSGATISGNGTILGAVTLNNGGRMAVDTGNLQMGSLKWNSNGSISAFWRLSNTDNTSDQLTIVGDFERGTAGSQFVFDFEGTGYYNFSTPSDTVYNLLSFGTNVGFTADKFTWTNLNAGLGAHFQIVGNNLQLVVVPEPATWGLILGGITLLASIRRKRANKAK